MSGWPILSTLIFFPLMGALVISFINDSTEDSKNNVRVVALATTIFTFLISLVILLFFDSLKDGYQFQENIFWLGRGLSYHLGVDGLGLVFELLTALIMPFCILCSWKSIENRLKSYMVCFLVLESMLLGVFCSLNSLLFYVFFEGSLIPMFIIVGVWGGNNRVYASFKFFLYTLLGSVLMMIALMVMYYKAGTLDIVELSKFKFPVGLQYWLWFAFFASFAVKVPMWPVHTWLPDAHVQAPTAGSVILAGIMLKLGGYGFLRFSLPMFPDASAYFSPLVFFLSVVAIIYTSLVALVQTDIKKLIAYSSIAHMGYVTMGIFAANSLAINGAIFQMISHGFISSGLFLCVGVVYDRLHTRDIDAFGGLAKNMPLYATVFLILTMANVGLPGTSGFIGEFLPLAGTYLSSKITVILATTGVILSASYALYLYKRVAFGVLDKENLKILKDISFREKIILYPMVILTILFGIYPQAILQIVSSSVFSIVNNLH